MRFAQSSQPTGSRRKRDLALPYHADCLDGVFAAFVVAAAKKKEYRHIHAVPYDHNNEEGSARALIDVVEHDMDVCMVDAVPGPQVLEILSEIVPTRNVSGFDHHPSAERMFRDFCRANPEWFCSDIDIDSTKRSATRFVWQRLMNDRPVPDAVWMVDKMDGNAAGLVTPEDFAAASYIDAIVDLGSLEAASPSIRRLLRTSFNTMAQRGKPIFAAENKKIDKLLDEASFAELCVRADRALEPVMIVNANVKHFGRIISHRMVDHAVEHGSEIAMAWSLQKNGRVIGSIRSAGDVDCEEIADYMKYAYGTQGGGHAHSAQVRFPSLQAFHNFLNPVHQSGIQRSANGPASMRVLAG